MTGSRLVRAAAALLLLGIAFAAAAAAQRKPVEQPPLIIKSTVGADLYRFYCSNCHGMTGNGSPARSELLPAPPDLTVLSKNNGGVYPRDRVRATILYGENAPAARAHGTADMPVWGTIFRGLEPSDTMVEIRIENLVQYIASIQEPDAGGAPD